MKAIKALGLASFAAAALLAFASSATGSTLTSPAGTVYTNTITAISGSMELHFGTGLSSYKVRCKNAHIEGKIEQHGWNTTAQGSISSLAFGECGSDTVTVLKKGILEVHDTSGPGNGTVTSSGAEIRIHTSLGIVCTFKTSITDIGTLTGSTTTGGKATLDIGSSSIPASGFSCPSTGVWTGDYTVQSPSYLDVDAGATTLTSPAGTIYTNTITAEAGKTSLHPGSGTSFLTVSCQKSHLEGKVERHGSGLPVGGKVSSLSFDECGNDVVTVLKTGELDLHATGAGNGKLTSTGAEILIHTSEGPVCAFKTSGTDIGTLTGSTTTGGKATLDIGSAVIPSTGFLCPKTGVWTGDYTVQNPGFLGVEYETGSIPTSPAGTIYTSTITAEAGKTSLHPGSGTSFLTVTCQKSHLEGKVERHGSGQPAGGKLSKLSFSECGNDVVTVLKTGELDLHATGSGNGTLTSTGAEITIHTSEGPVCTFTTKATDIGTFTGSSSTGGKATLHLNGAVIPSTGFACPSTGIWTGDYTVASPGFLDVD